MNFPTTFEDITAFERNNAVSIKVLGWDEDKGEITCHRLPERKCSLAITLFLIESDDGRSHYCVVKNMSRLTQNQLSKHGHTQYFCDYCNYTTQLQDQLETHTCVADITNGPEKVMPEEGEAVNFKNPERGIEQPHTIYADFESALNPIDRKKREKTTQYQRHRPSGYTYHLVSRVDPTENLTVSYTAADPSEDVAQHFFESLEATTKALYGEDGKYGNPREMVFGESEAIQYDQVDVCYVCTGEFASTKGEKKVRDHCHFTGKFRGAAQAACNLKLKKSKKIPVFFHNLAGYDSHLFIRNLGTTAGDVNCIPVNDEQFISFTKNVVVGEY